MRGGGGKGYITVKHFALASVFIIIRCLEDSNQGKKFNVSSRFEAVSFRVVLQDATTELQHSAQVLSYTTIYLIKAFITVLLAQPFFIHSSATQSKWAAFFPPKATTTVCLAFCINPCSTLYSTVWSSVLSARGKVPLILAMHSLLNKI